MIGIIGDIETDNLLVMAVLALNEREDETTKLLLRALNLKLVLTLVFYPGVAQMLGITDGQWDILAHLKLRGVEITCPHEDAHHVIHTILVSRLLPLVLSRMLYAVLLQLTVAVGI